MDILDPIYDRFEMYQIMAKCFFDRLDDKEKVEALNDVIDTLKGTYD